MSAPRMVTDADVERVARAMYELRPISWGSDLPRKADSSHYSWDELMAATGDQPRHLVILMHDQARAAIAAYEATGAAERSGWRPIETAPKDGTTVLLYYSDGIAYPLIASGFWNPVKNEWWLPQMGEASHWMPLPDPPTTEPPTMRVSGAQGSDEP